MAAAEGAAAAAALECHSLTHPYLYAGHVSM